VNTFDAVEPGAAAVLRQPEPWRPPVYPIGPLTRPAAAAAATGCIDWLDAQPERSVLFVSFGSGGSGGARNLRLGMPHIKKFQSKYAIQWTISYNGHNKFIIITKV